LLFISYKSDDEAVVAHVFRRKWKHSKTVAAKVSCVFRGLRREKITNKATGGENMQRKKSTKERE
jgi:hypothetical protein